MISLIVIVGIPVTLFFVLPMLGAALIRTYQALRRRRSKPAPVTGPKIGDVPDVSRADLLALACGPCNSVPGTRTCICAGHCGRQGCRGAAVVIDMASALQRITREARRG